MTPERWQEVKRILANALELPTEERTDYLDRNCPDTSLRNDVELLLSDEQVLGGEFLSGSDLAAAAADALRENENPWLGRRVGPYRIVERIGAGGMGEVYRAFRADDQYRKEVALKLVRSDQDFGFVIQRFKNERQILATLDHPNIARLLDGGTTDTGAPYFVMEFIDGQPITAYCDQHKLSVNERLKLFSSVCAAVQYAHQHLIIHRDIKPGNILVTSEGTPKLLDFGIAKILESDVPTNGSDATLTTFQVLTPRYASPEQIKGEPMTTASDVYSLGVVLYELLTGETPYGSGGTPQEIASAVCTVDPTRPSTAVTRRSSSRESTSKAGAFEQSMLHRDTTAEKLRKRLSGDLDNIVLMSLRKEPSRRYASVGQFVEDIRRHLENLPVVARKDTFAYRATKFVSRHRLPVAASALLAVAILGAWAITLHEARVAREQAEIARIQKARAERRFNDVRKLANSLIFEVHDSIRDMPGANATRKLVVERAIEFLDSLSKEAGGDASLQRDLAAAYDRVGDLQGYTGASNLGDFAAALQSYRKALAIREVAAAGNPDNLQIQSDLLNGYFRASFVLKDAGDSAGALTELRKGLPLAQKLADTNSDDRYKDWLAGFHWQMGNALSLGGDYSRALESYRKALSIRQPIAASGNDMFRLHLVADLNAIASMLWRLNEVSQALENSSQATQLMEQISLANPTNATLREYLGESYNIRYPILQTRGDFDAALQCASKANKIFAELLSSDSSNSLARDNFGLSGVGYADILIAKGRPREAMPFLQSAMTLFKAIEHKTRYDIAGEAQAYRTLGQAYVAMARGDITKPEKTTHLREARSWYQKSLETWQQDANHGSPDPFGSDENGRVKRELGSCDQQLAALR